ncbi:MAG TPA: sensor histidine kinase [Bacteroides uniformis]|nr:sensor histidine kinase [Bacteroides uniformis]
MEKRIRIVWALSLISMLLLVAGQGYWLWNQYQYKNEEYEEEIHRLVMDAVAVNDSIRREQPKKVFNKPNISFFNTNVDMHTDRDSLTNKLKERYTRTFVVGAMADKSVLSTAMKDSIVYSVLATKLDGMSFTTGLVTPRDSLYQWVETVERLGSDLHPVIRLVYPYNPLKRELVQVDVQVMPHTLLLRMGWQLLGSLVLILLLAVCLLFQIKTILKQHRVDELRKSFVNTMIHELKRPVQALKMCVSFLNDKTMRTDEQAMDEVVRDSVSELDNLSAYLRKLRDMTRADDEQTQLSLSTFDLKPVVEKLIRLQHAPGGKQVSFETHFTDNLLVTADPVHMANIITNLMENAVKYSGSSVSIRVECRLHGHELTLKVSDDGIGIPVSEQGRVFDKFYRSSNLPDRSLPGIGLGLSYVKLLVEAHRGTVFLTSQIGRGTTVEITIPQ